MALDAATLALTAGELKQTLTDAKIAKIFEPTRDELVLTLRTRTETYALLLSARSGSARVCLTEESFENPETPPSFCMLMRKHLTGGKLLDVRMEPGDRIVYFTFQCTNEMGDLVQNILCAELMGRYSNLVLVQNGKIIDALKRVDFEDSDVRQLLPGLPYTIPPKPARPDFLQVSAASIVAAACERDLSVADALNKTVAGVGPVVCREAAWRAFDGEHLLANELDDAQKRKLMAAIDELKNGTVDLLTKVTSASAVEQGNKLPYAYAKVSYPRTGLSMISFCCESSAVSSQAVRQAIAYCTDRDAIVSSYVGANGQRVDGYYGVGQWVYQLVSGKMAAPVARVSNAASDEEKAAYNATMADWNSLSLANVATYALNLDAAKALLDQDGWALNADGIREKLVGDQTVQLKLSLVYPEGNTIADALQAHMVENLAQVGIELTLQAKPMAELLKLYYRQEARDCDMIYLATNFSVCFDPSATFSPDDAAQGVSNRTAIADEELYQLAKDMSSTVPGDLLGYCRKWIAFQERYAEILPAIPVYSNNYNDYYTKRLKSFKVSERVSWAEAIEDAYRDDVQP